jgi:signal transduction histidine kinase
MTDAERVLQILLHDLRTPIGVAQGYLRMMQDGRLTEAAETERAMAKALQALGQTARLCQDASDFLETSNGQKRVALVTAATFATQVESEARNRGVEVQAGRIPAGARLALAGDVGRIGDAVLLVASAAGLKRPTLSIEADDAELRFLAADEPGASTTDAMPFDGWSRGLPLAVACRRIAWSSGRILKLATNNGVIVAFPLTSETGEKDGSV